MANETLDEDDAGDGVPREPAPNAGEGLSEWYRETGVECTVDGESRDILQEIRRLVGAIKLVRRGQKPADLLAWSLSLSPSSSGLRW